MIDNKKKKKTKVGKPVKAIKPVKKPKSRRGMSFSVDNILPNLKKAYNTLRPALNLPSLGMTKTLYDMNEAEQRKAEERVYKKGEKLPMRVNSNKVLYGDGSGRSYKQGGFTSCINRFDGERPESNCHKEKVAKGMTFTPERGWENN
jgi:hypothetical protein